jgi:hypothetical protein
MANLQYRSIVSSNGKDLLVTNETLTHNLNDLPIGVLADNVAGT